MMVPVGEICFSRPKLSTEEAVFQLDHLLGARKRELLERGYRVEGVGFLHAEGGAWNEKRAMASTWMLGTEPLIVYTTDLIRLSADEVEAVLSHEWGHALDSIEGGSGRKGHGFEEIERRADELAETVWGRPIYYGGVCWIQNHVKGERPRPLGLRRAFPGTVSP
jgi:hypothetical protein